MNIILIGGSGFLGKAIAKRLAVRGDHVYTVVHNRPVDPGRGITPLPGGIEGLTTKVLGEIAPGAIFHCARPAIPRLRAAGRWLAAMRARQLNHRLIQRIASCKAPPPLLFASGSLAYGNSPDPHDENAPLNPVSYARQYHHGETPILENIGAPGSKTLVLRFPWILGKGSWFEWFYRRPALDRQVIPLFGEGNNMMSLIGLEDAAGLMVRCLENNLPAGVCNVVTPLVMTQSEFAREVAIRFRSEIRDYKTLFPKKPEKAVLEAFGSNILLSSRHTEFFAAWRYRTLEEILSAP